MSAGFAVSRRHFVAALGGLGSILMSGRRAEATAEHAGAAQRTAAAASGATGAMDSSVGRAAKVVLERHVAEGYSPGMVGVIGRGSQADVLVVGRQSLQTQQPMRRDSIFRIASMTKPITAAVA